MVEIIEELETVSALVQTVADAVANRFGAKDTQHIDVTLTVTIEKLEECIQRLENTESNT